MEIFKDNKKIVEGQRSLSGDGLWDIPITKHHQQQQHLIKQQQNNQQKLPSINIILRTNKKATDLAMYLHGSVFSPTHDTFIKAIENNFFLGWPGLTSQLIKKHLPPSTSTVAGHMKQEQQGLRSTKIPQNFDR